MKFRLYFKGKFLSEHGDFGAAEAEARWNYFVSNGKSWEEYDMPRGYMILAIEEKAA